MTSNPIPEVDQEIAAISAVYAAVRDLEQDAQTRVLSYVAMKLKINFASFDDKRLRVQLGEPDPTNTLTKEGSTGTDESADEFGSISPVAKRWMSRNGLQAEQLSALFSLGVDEIDLVAKTVPGENKKERMRNVFLLKGIAAYLATGAARFTHEQIKETCLHYDAFDATNFATYLRQLSSEVSGSRSAGYTLTARGITSATEVVKSMTQGG